MTDGNDGGQPSGKALIDAKFRVFGKQEDGTAIRSNANQIEDEFQGYYEAGDKGYVISPPFDLKRLRLLAQENNALGPCIDAMETNVDGTGHVIETTDDEEDEDEGLSAKRQRIEDFFAEPYPGMSFTSMRRALRRDAEGTGNAALEVMRSATGEMVFLRPIPFQTLRMVKLDEAVPVEKRVVRGGQEVRYTVMIRERRFAQMVGNKMVYFKEFGASRDLDKGTGKWAEPGQRLPFSKRANEIIHLKIHDDVATPYGVPRWIEQVPSILGSRRAEEFNLAFFDSGGVPPLLITISGGELAERAVEAVSAIASGRAKDKHRIAVLEAYSTGGSLDKEAGVKIGVERFGSERQADSMFENYDERCEMRIRRSFRLPPIFVGQANDYSFATAFASYKVAEAQVFAPEREEFDEMVNTLIMPELDPERDFRYRSLPLTIDDIDAQLRAIEMASRALDNQGLLDALNETTNLNLKPAEGMGDQPVDVPNFEEDAAGVAAAGMQAEPVSPEAGAAPNLPAPVAASDRDLSDLATELFRAVRKSDGRIVALARAADRLPAEQRRIVYRTLAAMRYADPDMADVAEAHVCAHSRAA